MAPHSRLNCRRRDRRWPRNPAWLVLPLLLAACATPVEEPPVDPHVESVGSDVTANYLAALRDYLSRPAAQRAAHLERLRAAADSGSRKAGLEHALALSVERDDRSDLEQARNHFRQVLASPEPLPVPLDTFIRLRLAQVNEQLEHLEHSAAVYRAGQATAAALDKCQARLRTRDDELAALREKLSALTRIEQTVEDKEPPERNDRPAPDQDEDDQDEDTSADPARR